MHDRDQDVPGVGAHERRDHTLPMILLGDVLLLPRREPVVVQIERNPQARSYCALEAALAADGLVVLVMVPASVMERFHGMGPPPLPMYGVLARLALLPNSSTFPDSIMIGDAAAQHGVVTVAVTSVRRVVITTLVQDAPLRRATCQVVPDTESSMRAAHALVQAVQARVEANSTLLSDHAPESLARVQQLTQPGELADWVAYGPAFTFQDRLDVLHTLNPVDRLRKVYDVLRRT